MSNEKKNDGGTASPIVLDDNWTSYHEGLSRRDYFAAKAMQAMSEAYLFACQEAQDAKKKRWEEIHGQDLQPGEHIAIESYSMADFMLKAREQ